jgi:hypothetical protein
MHLPSLGGATGWLNSEPLGPAGLRGDVVLVNLWTLTTPSPSPSTERGLASKEQPCR